MGLPPFFCHNGVGDPLATPPPAHCGIPPYQLDPKTMGKWILTVNTQTYFVWTKKIDEIRIFFSFYFLSQFKCNSCIWGRINCFVYSNSSFVLHCVRTIVSVRWHTHTHTIYTVSLSHILAIFSISYVLRYLALSLSLFISYVSIGRVFNWNKLFDSFGGSSIY